MSVTAKIKCQTKESWGTDGQVRVTFVPDYNDDRNKEWARFTPALSLDMTLKDEVAHHFETGQAYTLTFEPTAE